MNKKIHVYSDAKEMSQAAADFFIKKAKKAIDKKGRFAVSFSGGSTPRQLFELLAKKSNRKQVNWKKVHVFWGDERCVPANSPDSNSLMAREALLNKVPIPEDQIYVIDGVSIPRTSAAAYEFRIRQFFTGGSADFDLFLLGLGDDGHTASLFPGTAVVEEDSRWVRAVHVEKMDSWRITLTAPVINQADCVAFLVSGKNKAKVLPKVIDFKNYQPNKYPAQLIVKGSDNVHWFLDEAASGNLDLSKD